ncbi:MAG: hypothetical protein MJZ64_06490 [Paludibacteraceae bacterium]|nr:hypothetical protein [Paludibacteraceae bacterium]
MLLGAMTMSAADYTHSVGVNVGSQYGVSYKGFIFGVDGLALQVDLGVRLEQTAGSSTSKYDSDTYKGKIKDAPMYTFEANPNVLYQKEFYTFDGGSLSWYTGGGLSLGLMGQLGKAQIKGDDEDSEWGSGKWITDEEGKETVYGKFGVNAVAGLELNFSNAPLALSFDFRPGYGLGFWNKKVDDVKRSETINFFDWSIAVGLRYRL